MSEPSQESLIELGVVQDAQGHKGHIKVRPHASDPVALLACKELLLSLLPRKNVAPTAAQHAASLTAYKVKEAKLHSGFVVLALEGVADRDQALAIKGARVMVSRDAFPEAGEGSFYWVDLIGCRVNNLQGEDLGLVLEMTENGAHAVMAIGNSSDSAPKHLIPFVPQMVQNVDLPTKRITVDWQADW